MVDLKNDGYFKIKISSPHKGESAEFTVWWEADIWEWITVFKNMLTWLGFHNQTITEAFPEEE